MPTPSSDALAIVDSSQLKAPGDARHFDYRDGSGRTGRGVLLRVDARTLVAFDDHCPHWGVPLGEDPSRLFDPRDASIVCSMHRARFDPHSGLCHTGLCEGQHLTRFQVSEGPGVGLVIVKRSGLF
ncbi:Rieske (2Fe-2S) protein [Lujinxingia sediminis]|nr:Rieske 2Fe-2S domain-containing protein [Lujinxingia sediminis]